MYAVSVADSVIASVNTFTSSPFLAALVVPDVQAAHLNVQRETPSHVSGCRTESGQFG